MQKGFCSPGAYKKGMSTDMLDPAGSLPLCLYKLHLLQPFRNRGQRWCFFYPEVPEHLRLKILSSLLPPLFLLHSLALVGNQLLIAVSCPCPSLPSEKHLLGGVSSTITQLGWGKKQGVVEESGLVADLPLLAGGGGGGRKEEEHGSLQSVHSPILLPLDL